MPQVGAQVEQQLHLRFQVAQATQMLVKAGLLLHFQTEQMQ
jgi:hypothetical protein